MESKIIFRLPQYKEQFALASTLFDCNKFNPLPIENKINILLAGTRIDVFVSIILVFLGIFIILLSQYLFIKKSGWALPVFILGIIFLILVFAKLVNVTSNLTLKQGTDAYWISHNLSC